METGFEKAWERFLSGTAPAHIVIHEKFADDDIEHERYPVGAWGSFDEDSENRSNSGLKTRNKKSRRSKRTIRNSFDDDYSDKGEIYREAESFVNLNGKYPTPEDQRVINVTPKKSKKINYRRNSNIASDDDTNNKETRKIRTKRSRSKQRSKKRVDDL
jgi:hypothetical protein